MKILQSSANPNEVMLRIKSFFLLLVPSLITLIGIITGQEVAQQRVIDLVDAMFVVAFAVIQIYAWIRSIKMSNKSL